MRPFGIGRVAGAVVPAAVERQKPRRLAFQVGTELDLVLVHGKVGHAAAELEQFLTRVAVLLVLPDGVVRRLFREVVLQFKREDRQSVDEKPDIERPLRLVLAVAKLPDDGDNRFSSKRFRAFLLSAEGVP